MNCEIRYCRADRDSASAFDLVDDTITIYVDQLKQHSNHTVRFLFEDKVMIMGMKDNVIQLWREENTVEKESSS